VSTADAVIVTVKELTGQNSSPNVYLPFIRSR
jgi:hypothetical protein